MALPELSQPVELLGRTLPAARVAFPQKDVFGISASRAAVVGTARGGELYPVMNLDESSS